MAARTKIEWTNQTWNVVTGCSKISAGCKNCYAENYAQRFWGARKFTDIMLHEDKLNYPLTVKKPSMFFVNSMSDLFHHKVPDDFIIKIFTTMMIAPRHTFQILTKRSMAMKDFVDQFLHGLSLSGNAKLLFKEGMKSDVLLDYFGKNKFPENVWLGVSVEDEENLGRIRHLIKTNCAKRFVSFEPLLEPIDFFNWTFKTDLTDAEIKKISWAIIGCESGHKKRNFELIWVRKLVAELKRFGIPIFIKQLNIDDKVEKDINNFPKDLRIREYPL